MTGDEGAQDIAFFDAMRGEDDLGVVIRGAIYIESKLIELIESNLRNPAVLGRMEYSDRVNLAIALGLDSSLAPALNAIGRIRNKFAHEIRSSLTDEDANALYSALDSQLKSLCNEVYESLTRSPKYGSNPKKLSTQEPKYRWSVYLIGVRSLLKEAIHQSGR